MSRASLAYVVAALAVVLAAVAIARMAVNISVSQFVRSDFPTLVSQVLAETGLAPEVLELEITESLLVKDAEGAVHTLKALKDRLACLLANHGLIACGESLRRALWLAH